MSVKYEYYFDIKDDRGLVVNQANFEQDDMWIYFYPHETFVKLIRDTIQVLSKSMDKSIWIEGAYGTGKSHAALTLKKLLDCNNEQFDQYTQKYKDQIDIDVKNSLIGIRSKHNLTVFVSSIFGVQTEEDLVAHIQEGIEKELGLHGFVVPLGSLKDNAIKWLQDPHNNSYFDAIVKKDPKQLLGDLLTTVSADAIVQRLQEGIRVEQILQACDQLAKTSGIKIFNPSLTQLKAWIKDAIDTNKLNSIVFFWDEFTEFFSKGNRRMAGFQSIVEFCTGGIPFYLVPITHQNTDALLSNASQDERKKISNRFLSPTKIELSQNIAIELMGNALTKNAKHQQEWQTQIETPLYDRATQSRQIISKSIGIKQEQLKAVLPLHPYAAIILRYLSASFDSNQRSMFSFLTQDKSGEGFKKFISQTDKDAQEPFLTVPYLWEFFYTANKDHLNKQVNNILSAFNKAKSGQLDDKQTQVFKAILLLIATSKMENDASDILRPTLSNLRMIFDGNEHITGYSVDNLAKVLKDKNLISQKTLGDDIEFGISQDFVDNSEVDRQKKLILEDTRTTDLISEMGLDGSQFFLFDNDIKDRFKIKILSKDNLTAETNKLINQDKDQNCIHVFLCLAKTVGEFATLRDSIAQKCKLTTSYDIVFVNAGDSVLSEIELDEYADCKARAQVSNKSNQQDSMSYTRQAKGVLAKWKQKIEDGNFELSIGNTTPYNVPNIKLVTQELKNINKRLYPYAVENIFVSVPNTLWNRSNLKAAIMLGLEGSKSTIKGAIGSAKAQIAQPISDIFDSANFWVARPNHTVSMIKVELDRFVDSQVQQSREVSILDIYNHFKDKPYGFLDTAMSGFLLAFLLRSYLNGEYLYKDKSISEQLTDSKLSECITNAIKQSSTPSNKFEDQYIALQTPSLNEFAKASFEIFKIQSTSVMVSTVIDNLRYKVNELVFPLLVTKEVAKTDNLIADKSTAIRAIDMYCGVLNNKNYQNGQKNDTQIASELGQLLIDNPSLKVTLAKLFSVEGCKNGMSLLATNHQDGKLVQLSNKLGVDFITQLKAKFQNSAGNWTWNTQTVLEQLEKLSLEFELILQSTPFGIIASNEQELAQEWQRVLGESRICFAAVQHKVGCKELVLAIQDLITQQSVIKQKPLLDLFLSQSSQLKDLLDNSISYFADIFEDVLEGLDKQQVDSIYAKINTNQFDSNRESYIIACKRVVQEYKSGLANQKLQAIFKDKTGHSSPDKWSLANKTPILIMVDQSRLADAKNAFSIMTKTNPNQNDVDFALKFLLDTHKLWDDLKDTAYIDKQFGQKIIGKYSKLVRVEECRSQLMQTMPNPYEWSQSSQTRSIVEQLAKQNYAKTGKDQVQKKLDSMTSDTLKSYIMQLIQDNYDVGISIINEE